MRRKVQIDLPAKTFFRNRTFKNIPWSDSGEKEVKAAELKNTLSQRGRFFRFAPEAWPLLPVRLAFFQRMFGYEKDSVRRTPSERNGRRLLNSSRILLTHIELANFKTKYYEMKSTSNRDDFSKKIKGILAKRAGFLCSICNCFTIGPSMESITSTTNIGVAAHITAAASGGPRYEPSIRSEERVSISNGIWLCQNHAAIIDRDTVKWTKEELLRVKEAHEKKIKKEIGIPNVVSNDGIDEINKISKSITTPREYAYLPVNSIIPSYRKLIDPILQDKQLGKDSILGVLMCETEGYIEKEANGITWTIFVNAEWLKWVVSGKRLKFHTDLKIPREHLYGQIPAWPDTHIEFLKVITETKTTFYWNRHPNGYLILAQR